MRYIVVTGAAKDESESIERLEELVNRHIEDGWLPCGGVLYAGKRTYSIDNEPGKLTPVGPTNLTWHNEEWHLYRQAMFLSDENESEAR